MHKQLEQYISKHKNVRFSAEDLALVIGDIMYSLAINSFLAIEEDSDRKMKTLLKFTEAAIFTGSGEFIDLVNDMKPIQSVTREEIDRAYDLKTAIYTFSYPLSGGAILAGVPKEEEQKLEKLGLLLGRAFQLKDDSMGMLSENEEFKKTPHEDLRNMKRTVLLWYAFNNSDTQKQDLIQTFLSNNSHNDNDYNQVRSIIIASGAIEFAENEIDLLLKQAATIIKTLEMKPEYRKALEEYTADILAS